MYTLAGIFTAGIVIFIQSFMVTPFINNGLSMNPTIKDHEYVFVEKNSTEFQRGDIIVFAPKMDAMRSHYLKRIVGLPGETLNFSGGTVYIKKKGENTYSELTESYLSSQSNGHTYMPEYITEKEFLIPNDSYWVMGDNRQNSADSRHCFQNCFNLDISAHFLKRSQITGKIFGK